MGILRKTIVAAGMMIASFLMMMQGAQAKCTPATERLLPRPLSAQFVAVLITCDDHMDALRAYADVSTKHPNVLASTPMQVTEVNLGAKGIYYRTLVGGPSSKDAAAATCKTLKAAGYNWCRVMRH